MYVSCILTVYYLDQTHNSMYMSSSILIIPAHRKFQTYLSPLHASHKSNPFSAPQGYVDSYSTLPCITWEAVTSVEGYPDEGYYDTRWLMGL